MWACPDVIPGYPVYLGCGGLDGGSARVHQCIEQDFSCLSMMATSTILDLSVKPGGLRVQDQVVAVCPLGKGFQGLLLVGVAFSPRSLRYPGQTFLIAA